MKSNFVKDWRLVRTFSGAVQMHGTIYNDTKGRFLDGARIGTSKVLRVDFESGVLVTKNTTYNLDIGSDGNNG